MSAQNQPGAMLYTQAFGSRPENVEVPVYSNRDPSAQDVNYPVGKEWINVGNSIWKLLNINSSGGVTTANWVAVAGNNGGLLPMSKMVTEFGDIVADNTGEFGFLGIVTTTNPGSADKAYTGNTDNGATTDKNSGHIALLPATTSDLAGSSPDNAGPASFSEDQFDVDANGFVSLKGSTTAAPILGITVDTGTTTIVADGTGLVDLTAGVVANAGVPIQVDGVTANSAKIEVQFAKADVATDATDVGLASFDSAQFSVDPNGFVQLAMTAVSGTSYPGLVNNLAFAKAVNTTTFTGFDGTALSAANPATVWINHPSSRSQLVNVSLVNPWQVIDAGGAGDMNGNSFGTSSGAWATDMPWYIYIVVNDAATSCALAISRVPHLTVAPAVGNCATRGSAVASTQGSMYFLDEVILGVPTAPTVANFDTNPCVCVGGWRMQKAAANDWVVQTPDKSDGIGLFHENAAFTYPGNQNTANPVTNDPTHFVETAGFPAYAGQNYFYTMSKSGYVEANLIMANLTANGANATDIVLTLPIKNMNFSNKQVGYFGVTGSPLPWIAMVLNGGSISGSFKWESASSAFLTNADVTGAPDAAAQFNVALNYIADIA